MPSLAQLAASQLGMGGPLATAGISERERAAQQLKTDNELAALTHATEETRKRAMAEPLGLLDSRARGLRRKALNNLPPLIPPPPPPVYDDTPIQGPSFNKLAAQAGAPKYERGKEIADRIVATGKHNLMKQFESELAAIASRDPALALPAADTLIQWYNNSEYAMEGIAEPAPKPAMRRQPRNKPKEKSKS